MRCFIVQNQNKVAFVRNCELHDHRAVSFGAISVTDDVGKHFLEAKTHGGFNASWNSITYRQSLDPSRKLCDLRKTSSQQQSILKLIREVGNHAIGGRGLL